MVLTLDSLVPVDIPDDLHDFIWNPQFIQYMTEPRLPHAPIFTTPGREERLKASVSSLAKRWRELELVRGAQAHKPYDTVSEKGQTAH